MNVAKRLSRRIFRGFVRDSRERQLRSEVDYWRAWFETKGLEWPDDYHERLDPARPLTGWVSEYVERIEGDRVEILDVGSGPITKLGKVHPSKRVEITAVDQLADEYNALIDERCLAPPVRTNKGDAESLRTLFPERTFDIVHAENSMDHARNPIAAVEQMLALARPGGFVLLVHAEHEGLNNRYSGLHQWDFLSENGRFIIAGPGPNGGRHDMSQKFAGEADIECWLHDDGVYVAMAKKRSIGAR